MKRIHYYIIALLLVAVAFSAGAVTVQSQAGALKDVVTDTNIGQLTVTGTVDAADIDFIASELTGLTALDLSAATVVAYSGTRLSNGRRESPANTLPEYSLTGSRLTSIILPASLTAIGDGALAGSAITSLVIPAGVTTLGAGFCNGCTSLASVRFETRGLDALPPGAFKGCTSLPSIEIPRGVLAIGADAMRGCTALTGLSLPSTLVTIGDRAFNGCTSLAAVSFPASLTAIGEDAFSATAIATVDLSGCDRLSAIGGWAFAGCDRLDTAILPPGVTTLGDGLFFDCGRLARVVMPASVTRLAPYMFKGTSITDPRLLGNSLTTIGRYALYGNDSLTVLGLPGTVTSIGDKAMANMPALERINCAGLTELPALGDDVFLNTAGSDVILSVAESMVEAFKAAPQWKEFNVIYDTSSVADVTADGSLDVVMRYDTNTLYINSSVAMSLISVCDLSGRIIARHAADGALEATVGLNRAPGTAVIVSITLTDSHTATFKTIL
ncbi:MAG: leucine-rich repeat domain-containing protein [Muribaculaceae bacterium]|nr:leucine-rich repeat domain-containing protein [Muribaculaceae bacterium]